MSAALSALSERQKDELHKSMLDYLRANGMTESYQALAKEANLADLVLDPKAKYAGLLEKKWTSVIRLQKKTIDLEQRVAALQEELSAAPSTRRMASATDWVPRNPARHTLQGHRSPVTRLAFHPVFSQLVSASEDATLKLWDWETGEFERTLKGHTKAVQDADFDSKGNFLVSCSSDLSIKVWDTNNDWKNVKTLFGHDHSVSSVRFLPGDDMIVSASRDRTIRIWEMANGYCKRTLSGHAEWVRAVVPSLDGRLLASASNDQTACIWDFSSGEVKHELRGHEHVVECVVFAPVAAYAAIRELAGITGSKDERSGLYVATGSRDKTLRLWETTSGQCLKTFEGHDNWVRALVFAPSGKFLLSASDDRTIKTWDLKTGRCAKTLEAHGHFITHLAWGRARIDGSGSGADGTSAPAPDGPATPAGTNGRPKETEARVINVAATCSVDLSIKIWTP